MGGQSSSPTGWREARTEALDLVCLMNNSVKAKAAEAALVGFGWWRESFNLWTLVQFDLSNVNFVFIIRWDFRRSGRAFSRIFAFTATCHTYLGFTGTHLHCNLMYVCLSWTWIQDIVCFSSFRLASRRFIQELFLEVDFSRWRIHSFAVVMTQLIAFLFCRMDEEAMHVLGQNHISWSGLMLTENTFSGGPNLTQEAR